MGHSEAALLGGEEGASEDHVDRSRAVRKGLVGRLSGGGLLLRGGSQRLGLARRLRCLCGRDRLRGERLLHRRGRVEHSASEFGEILIGRERVAGVGSPLQSLQNGQVRLRSLLDQRTEHEPTLRLEGGQPLTRKLIALACQGECV